MKNNVKKISVMLSAIMLASAMPTALAAEKDVYVSHFDSFETWTSAKGAIDDLPEGFFANDGEKHPARAEAAGSVYLESDYTQAVALKKGAVVGYRFDEVYKKGILNVSFDLKFPTFVEGNFWIFSHENDGNDNVYDLWGPGVDGTGITASGGIDWDYTPVAKANNGVFGSVNGAWAQFGDPKMLEEDTWCKVELVFDYDNDKLKVYADGTLLSERDYTAGNKTVYFNNEVEQTVYLDNFAVNYSTDREFAEKNFIKASTPSGTVSPTGGRMNVDFSKYDASVDLSSGFTVKDASGQVVADAVSTSGQGSAATTAVVILYELEPGEYTISHTSAANEANFTVAESKEVMSSDFATETYWYLNEDFESYKGGVPAGWRLATGSTKVTSEAESTLKLDKNATYSYVYDFEDPHTSGDLFVEFDVKSSSGDWVMAILPERALAEGNENSYTTLGNAWHDGCLHHNNNSYKWSLQSGCNANVLSTTDWNHIKVKLDMDAKKYIIDVNNGANTYEVNFPMINEGGNGQPIYGVIKDSTVYGVGGVRFGGSAIAEFDNVKVWTDNSYNLYDDLNGWNGGTWGAYLPQGWYRYADTLNPNNNRYYSVDGAAYNAETNANDKAMQITKTQGEPGRVLLTRPFNPRTKAFVLEYDLKIDTFDGIAENKSMATCVAVGPIERAFLLNPIVETRAPYQSDLFTVAKDGTLRFMNDQWGHNTKIINQATNEELTVTVGQWHHIKVECDPAKGVTVYLDGAKGQTKTDQNGYFSLIADCDNVGFVSFWNQDGGTHSVDNVKLYEVDTVTKPSIANVKVVNADGTKATISAATSELSALATGLEINFTSALDETDATMAEKVTLAKKNGEKVSYTGAISGDGKSYIITLNEKPQEAVSLNVKYSVKGATSEIAQLTDNVTYSFTPATGGEVKVTDVTLMKKIAGRTVETRVAPDFWTKATTLSDKDAAEYKVFVNGYNTTGAEDSDSYWYLTGTYVDENGSERMQSVTKTDVEVPNSVMFEKQFDLPQATEGLIWKAFVWNTDFMPVSGVISNN